MVPTPQMEAAQTGYTDLCTMLLEHNANVNRKSENHATLLVLAAQEGHGDVCTVLLEHNTNANDNR